MFALYFVVACHGPGQLENGLDYTWREDDGCNGGRKKLKMSARVMIAAIRSAPEPNKMACSAIT
jgi:hypothetical protein